MGETHKDPLGEKTNTQKNDGNNTFQDFHLTTHEDSEFGDTTVAPILPTMQSIMHDTEQDVIHDLGQEHSHENQLTPATPEELQQFYQHTVWSAERIIEKMGEKTNGEISKIKPELINEIKLLMFPLIDFLAEQKEYNKDRFFCMDGRPACVFTPISKAITEQHENLLAEKRIKDGNFFTTHHNLLDSKEKGVIKRAIKDQIIATPRYEAYCKWVKENGHVQDDITNDEMFEILYHNSKLSLLLSAKMREMLTRFFDSAQFLEVVKNKGLVHFNRRDIEKIFTDAFASHERLIGTRFPGGSKGLVCLVPLIYAELLHGEEARVTVLQKQNIAQKIFPLIYNNVMPGKPAGHTSCSEVCEHGINTTDGCGFCKHPDIAQFSSIFNEVFVPITGGKHIDHGKNFVLVGGHFERGAVVRFGGDYFNGAYFADEEDIALGKYKNTQQLFVVDVSFYDQLLHEVYDRCHNQFMQGFNDSLGQPNGKQISYEQFHVAGHKILVKYLAEVMMRVKVDIAPNPDGSKLTADLLPRGVVGSPDKKVAHIREPLLSTAVPISPAVQM